MIQEVSIGVVDELCEVALNRSGPHAFKIATSIKNSSRALCKALRVQHERRDGGAPSAIVAVMLPVIALAAKKGVSREVLHSSLRIWDDDHRVERGAVFVLLEGLEANLTKLALTITENSRLQPALSTQVGRILRDLVCLAEALQVTAFEVQVSASRAPVGV